MHFLSFTNKLGVAKVEKFNTQAEAETRAAEIVNANDSIQVFYSMPVSVYSAAKFIKSPF